MTVAQHPPGSRVTGPGRDSLPSATIPTSLRNAATVVVALLTITVVVLLALLFTDSEPVEIHDSWMSAQAQIEEVYDL